MSMQLNRLPLIGRDLRMSYSTSVGALRNNTTITNEPNVIVKLDEFSNSSIENIYNFY